MRDPVHTAAIAPSSPALAEAMAAAVPSVGRPTVVELGPGTGAITAAIRRRLGGRGRHLAIERQPRWASLLQQRFPDVDVVHGDVADLPAILTPLLLTLLTGVIGFIILALFLPFVNLVSGISGK